MQRINMSLEYDLKNDCLVIEGKKEVKSEEGNIETKVFDITIRRVKRKDLAKFTQKYEEVLRRLFEVDGAFGSFFIEDKNYNLLKQLCELIPIDEAPGKLDIEWIEENLGLLTLLFFTTSYDIEKGEFIEEKMRKSLIAKFNYVEYDTVVGKLNTETTILKLKNSKAMVQELEDLRTQLGV
jgi:hypothetical protein